MGTHRRNLRCIVLLALAGVTGCRAQQVGALALLYFPYPAMAYYDEWPDATVSSAPPSCTTSTPGPKAGPRATIAESWERLDPAWRRAVTLIDLHPRAAPGPAPRSSEDAPNL